MEGTGGTVTRLTASMIASRDDLVVSAGGPDSNGKYCAWLLYENGRPLLNTEPIYDSDAQARAAMDEFIRAVRKKVAEEAAQGPKPDEGTGH